MCSRASFASATASRSFASSEPVVAARGDRVVLRAETTVGGGRVLDPSPPRHASLERMELVERGEIAATVHEPVRAESLAHLGELAGVEEADGWVFSSAWLDELRAELDAAARSAQIRSTRASRRRRRRGRAPSCRSSASSGAARSSTGPARRRELGARAEAAAALEAELGLEPVKLDDAALGRFLEEQGRLVRVGDGYAISTAAYEEARDALVAECEAAGRITLARFRDLLGVGRKTAQLLLERFDADGLTRRVGDERVLRRRGTIAR